MKATASFTKFPKLNPDQKITDEKRKMIITILKDEGFNAVTRLESAWVLSSHTVYKESRLVWALAKLKTKIKMKQSHLLFMIYCF